MIECTTCDVELDIVDIVSHDCEQIISAEQLSTSERNMLMYIEARLVDWKGELDPDQMNYEDTQNLKLFRAVDLLEVIDFQVTEFIDQAWRVAGNCRRLRAQC